MAKRRFYPQPPIPLNPNAMQIYKRIIRQLDNLPGWKVDKAATIAKLAYRRDVGTADGIELALLTREADKLRVTV
ncbi:hypothetical protein G4Y73_06365 [Wenzhouxiangella sp. XN201]|uniref:hypothetical protein n=1 Tax=Wenzhouxiangella sp. XN201 TaxID=2710755 RepID=UPI0013CCE9BA|nr:hypothetical protein [Wenzhouxiangella sp. XN201]NEZ03772.1 hypothetical protein [Wenzhouxiangella sp. XN201]